MGVVSDVVRDRPDLGFGAGVKGKFEVLPGVVLQDSRRDTACGIAADRMPARVHQGAVMLNKTFERLEGEVETIKARIAPLQTGHHRQRLSVVVKPIVERKTVVECTLARMPE